MNYNDVIEVEVVESSSEPLSLDAVKEHLRLQFDTDGSYVFDDDDNKLQSLITQARETMEKFTGLSFMNKNLRAILRNECGNIEIPGGPIVEVTSVKDVNGTDITSTTTIRGNKFKWIETPGCYLDVEYEAGYDTLPQSLKEAMLNEIAYRYENRGDGTNKYAGEVIGISQGAMNLAAPYKRTSIIA